VARWNVLWPYGYSSRGLCGSTGIAGKRGALPQISHYKVIASARYLIFCLRSTVKSDMEDVAWRRQDGLLCLCSRLQGAIRVPGTGRRVANQGDGSENDVAASRSLDWRRLLLAGVRRTRARNIQKEK